MFNYYKKINYYEKRLKIIGKPNIDFKNKETNIKIKQNIILKNRAINKIKDVDIKIKYYEYFVEDIQRYNHTHIYSDNIYWCWLQGINNAPDLYKATFNSVKNACLGYNLIIINQTNLNKYVKFPAYILEKYQNKIIDNTHFSDLLRLELLIKYGGTWIDASVLITKYDEIFFKKDLFFFRTVNNTRISGSNWFITAEKENAVLKTTRDLLYEYWRKENYLCDYFIFHLLFKFAFQKYIDDYFLMPNFSNIPVHFLQNYLLKKFNAEIYSFIIKNSSIHKLNKRIYFSNDSFAHYLINKYGKLK